MTNRRHFLRTAIAGGALAGLASPSHAGIDHLPLARTFIGQEKFNTLLAKAVAGEWRKLPPGQRMARIAEDLRGIPYVGYTLEIDDKVECPSVNFRGLDCWTFFEAVLCFSRMLERARRTWTPQDLLREIQWTRYRAGTCTGNYLERIHYLNEWFIDNEARGNLTDITRQLGGAERLTGRLSREMTVLWKSYRYLKHNPDLRAGMAKIEAQVNQLPVFYIPKSRVAGIESKLAPGDIAGIVTNQQGGVCSHVGLIVRDTDGKSRFMHASANYKKVVVDNTLSAYLNAFKSHAGVIIARPRPVADEITSRSTYAANLKRLSGQA